VQLTCETSLFLQLSQQLQTMRLDVINQITGINKRLGKARITAQVCQSLSPSHPCTNSNKRCKTLTRRRRMAATERWTDFTCAHHLLAPLQFLKPGTTGGSHALGDRTPGTHVQRPSIVPGGGAGAGSNRVDGYSKQDLDDLRTDLEEQTNVAAALQTLMSHNKQLQETVEEWQTKSSSATALANQVALALQGQANRKSVDVGVKRAGVLKQELKVLNPDLQRLDGVAAYKQE
jgi:hypothetical protein